MNKQKIKGIIKFSIKQNIQSKWFIIFNVLLLILVMIIANADNIANFLENNNIKLFNDEMTIEYIDRNGLLGNSLEEKFKEYEKITVKKVEKNEYTQENIEDNVIVVEPFKDKEEFVKAKITSKEGIDQGLYEELLNVLTEIRTQEFAKATNVQKEQLELLNEEVNVERIMLGVDAENSDTKQMIQTVTTMVVYMISIFIFSKIANEIANEKVSKSIEYVLTSVTEKEYLFAKIASIITIVLIQAILSLVYYMMGNLLSSLIMMSSGAQLVANAEAGAMILDSDIVAYICVIFVYSILTLILLSIIQAALSSKTTNMSEAGNSMTFLMIITISVYMFTFVLINPYTNMTPIIYILSCIPLISNYFIPAIMIIGQAKTWQIIVSLALLIISIPITFNICSKVFKNGVLDYSNKKNKKRKNKKELSLKEEQNLKLEKEKFKTLALAIGMSVIIYFCMQIVAQLALGTLCASVFNGILQESQIELIVMASTSILSLVIPYEFVMLYTRTTKIESKTKAKDNEKMLLISFFLTFMLQVALVLLQKVTGLDNSAVENILDVDGLENIFTEILFVVAIAITPGIFEELFFRKGLINLTRKFGDKFAIFMSSLVFGICHLNITQGIFAFFMGLILGTLYVKTGKMRYNMALHAFNNAYAAIGAIFISVEWLEPYMLLYDIFILIIVAFVLLGGIVCAREIFIKRKRKQKLVAVDGQMLPENVKYMLSDYTFLVSILLMTLAFIVTENMLKLL